MVNIVQEDNKDLNWMHALLVDDYVKLFVVIVWCVIICSFILIFFYATIPKKEFNLFEYLGAGYFDEFKKYQKTYYRYAYLTKDELNIEIAKVRNTMSSIQQEIDTANNQISNLDTQITNLQTAVQNEEETINNYKRNPS